MTPQGGVDDATVGIYFFKISVVAGSATVAIDAGGTVTSIESDAVLITGLAGNVGDQVAGNHGAATTSLTTGTTPATTAANEAVLAAFSVATSAGFSGTWGSGFSSDGHDMTFGGPIKYGFLGGSKIVSSTGAQTGTLALSVTADDYVGLIISFK